MYRKETKNGTILLNNDKTYVENLTHGSGKTVIAVCPECGEKRELVYGNVVKTGHSLCWGCSKTINTFSKMIGKEFARWTVLSFAEPFINNDGSKSSTFLCRCRCGTERVVRAVSIKNGDSQSCGCLQKEKATEQSKSMVGKLHPSYKPEISEEDRQKPEFTRKDAASRKWRRAVKKRDGRCLVCGSKKQLEAHHLYDFNNHKDKRYEVENGVTMCKSCHVDFHRWKGSRVSCTPQDFQKFLLFKNPKMVVRNLGNSILSTFFSG